MVCREGGHEHNLERDRVNVLVQWRQPWYSGVNICDFSIGMPRQLNLFASDVQVLLFLDIMVQILATGHNQTHTDSLSLVVPSTESDLHLSLCLSLALSLVVSSTESDPYLSLSLSRCSLH